MTDNEFLLFDRIEKIKSIIGKYGEENFYISFSGGKDSTVLSWLIDQALPNNKIPRVYANTGIEYKMIVDFVKDMQKSDDRIIIIQPRIPIKKMLEADGYPFKSKEHAYVVSMYQRLGGEIKTVKRYINPEESRKSFGCPKILQYQFTDECNLKISALCCNRLKKEPLNEWKEKNNKPYSILGIRASEGGWRNKAKCLVFNGKKTLNHFSPLAPVSQDWEEWLIKEHNIRICDIYKPPYNFERTGCKGCPFNLNLQKDLEIMERYFPNERKQCEIIWKPVYDEYRRIGYRLKNKDDQKADEMEGQLSLFDYIKP